MFFRHVLCATLAGAAWLPAQAITFDFANLTWNGSSNAGFLPNDGYKCTGGDLCSSNVNGHVLNGDLTFVTGGLTARATGSFNRQAAAVVQDHENAYSALNHIGAGLGVYHLDNDTSDDNITQGEKLTISFDRVVKLTEIGLRAEGHNDDDWLTGATFKFNGNETLLPKNIGSIGGLNLIGTQFTFEFGGMRPDQFYVSSLTVALVVPEPSTYALMLGGLGAVGLMARRRKLRG